MKVLILIALLVGGGFAGWQIYRHQDCIAKFERAWSREDPVTKEMRLLGEKMGWDNPPPPVMICDRYCEAEAVKACK